MYGRLASAEKVECGLTLSFRRRKPSHTKSQLISLPLTCVELRDKGNPLLISHDFCYFALVKEHDDLS